MEELSAAGKAHRRSRKAATTGATDYKDAFSGPPRFSAPFGGIPEDYSEIFGGVNSSCSIPYLDLPVVSSGSFSCARVDYSEIFGRFDFADFAVPYEELFVRKEEDNVEDTASSCQRNLDKQGSSKLNLELPSNEHSDVHHMPCSAAAEFLPGSVSLNEHDKQFVVSFSRTSKEITSDPVVQPLGGFVSSQDLLGKRIGDEACNVDDSIKVDAKKAERSGPDFSSNSTKSSGSEFEADPKHPIVPSIPSGSSDKVSPFKHSVSDEVLLPPDHCTPEASVYKLTSDIPPPLKPPPPKLLDKRENSVGNNYKDKHGSFSRSHVDSPANGEVDSTSIAAASAAAMKEAMEIAQAKLKAAKESMVRKRETGRKKPSHHGSLNVLEVPESDVPTLGFPPKDTSLLTNLERDKSSNYDFTFLDLPRLDKFDKLTSYDSKRKRLVQSNDPQDTARKTAESFHVNKLDTLGSWKSDDNFYELINNEEHGTDSALGQDVTKKMKAPKETMREEKFRRPSLAKDLGIQSKEYFSECDGSSAVSGKGSQAPQSKEILGTSSMKMEASQFSKDTKDILLSPLQVAEETDEISDIDFDFPKLSQHTEEIHFPLLQVGAGPEKVGESDVPIYTVNEPHLNDEASNDINSSEENLKPPQTSTPEEHVNYSEEICIPLQEIYEDGHDAHVDKEDSAVPNITSTPNAYEGLEHALRKSIGLNDPSIEEFHDDRNESCTIDGDDHNYASEAVSSLVKELGMPGDDENVTDVHTRTFNFEPAKDFGIAGEYDEMDVYEVDWVAASPHEDDKDVVLEESQVEETNNVFKAAEELLQKKYQSQEILKSIEPEELSTDLKSEDFLMESGKGENKVEEASRGFFSDLSRSIEKVLFGEIRSEDYFVESEEAKMEGPSQSFVSEVSRCLEQEALYGELRSDDGAAVSRARDRNVDTQIPGTRPSTTETKQQENSTEHDENNNTQVDDDTLKQDSCEQNVSVVGTENNESVIHACNLESFNGVCVTEEHVIFGDQKACLLEETCDVQSAVHAASVHGKESNKTDHHVGGAEVRTSEGQESEGAPEKEKSIKPKEADSENTMPKGETDIEKEANEKDKCFGMAAGSVQDVAKTCIGSMGQTSSDVPKREKGEDRQKFDHKKERARSLEEQREKDIKGEIGRQDERSRNSEKQKGKDVKEELARDDEKDWTQRMMEEEKEREREREKDRLAVERATREANERAFAEARKRAEKIAMERIAAARQRASAEPRERDEKASTEPFDKSLSEKASREAKLRAERAAVERATAEARERAIEKARAEKAAADARERLEKFKTSFHESFKSDVQDSRFRRTMSENFQKDALATQGEVESALRSKARLERHQRTAERAAKALEEKNRRDLLIQREQAERDRMAEHLDAEVKRWSNGKEGNLRALLSTLQYILGPESGWQPVSLTDVITAAGVKKAYRKATLCVHPDKLQQRGANIQQKYICEKVFDLLKEAWNKFNSEER